MAGRPEAKFWGRVRDHLPPGTFARRIEDASGNLGTWDTFVCWQGHSFWIELKVGGPNEKPDLRPGQQGFGIDLVAAGGCGGYVMGSPDGQVRLIGPLTGGADWREHLVMRWPKMTDQMMLDLFHLVVAARSSVLMT